MLPVFICNASTIIVPSGAIDIVTRGYAPEVTDP